MKIAIIDDFDNLASKFGDWSKLSPAQVSFFPDHLDDTSALVERLKDFDIIGIMRERTGFPKTLLSQLPKLKLLITTGKQNAAIDLKAAQSQGILVCGTNSPGHATAELAFLLILAQARQLLSNVNGLKLNSQWQVALGSDCRGKTLGILGLGRLGSQLAILGNAIGMRVLAWSQNLTKEACQAQGVELVTKNQLFAQSDFVSIHLKLSERSKGIVGATELALLGSKGYVINTSRAEIIDQNALLAALDSGVLGGVATDVYVQEPATIINEKLLSHPLALCTPHIGYVTGETYEIFYGEMIEGIHSFIAGIPMRVIAP